VTNGNTQFITHSAIFAHFLQSVITKLTLLNRREAITSKQSKKEKNSKWNLIGCESVDVIEWLLNIHELLWFLACLPRYCVAPQSQQVSLHMWTNLHNIALQSVNNATVDIRLSPQFGVASWWVSLSSTALQYQIRAAHCWVTLSICFFSLPILATVSKRDVTDKTRSIQLITTPQQKDWAMAIRNIHENLVTWDVQFWRYACRQTYKHARHNTARSPTRGRVTSSEEEDFMQTVSSCTLYKTDIDQMTSSTNA